MFIYPIYYHNWINISTIYIYIYIYIRRLASNEIFSGVLISPQPDQEGNKLQRKKILMFIYPIYSHNWRNIITVHVYNKTSVKRNILTIKLGYGLTNTPDTWVQVCQKTIQCGLYLINFCFFFHFLTNLFFCVTIKLRKQKLVFFLTLRLSLDFLLDPENPCIRYVGNSFLITWWQYLFEVTRCYNNSSYIPLVSI